MKVDYAWSNGNEEVVVDKLDTIRRVFINRRRTGKVWRRTFGEDDLLEGVEDITYSLDGEESSKR